MSVSCQLPFIEDIEQSCLLMSLGCSRCCRTRTGYKDGAEPLWGSSPSKKCSVGMGELWLSLRKHRSILLWKILSGPMPAGCIGRDESPDLNLGREYVRKGVLEQKVVIGT